MYFIPLSYHLQYKCLQHWKAVVNWLCRNCSPVQPKFSRCWASCDYRWPHYGEIMWADDVLYTGTIWLQIFVRQYFRDYQWYLVYHVLYHRIHCFTRVEELPAITKWKTFLYHSIQFYSYSKPEVSKLLPTGVTEHPTQSASSPTQKGTHTKLTPKQRVTIGSYAILHGTSAALRHSKK